MKNSNPARVYLSFVLGTTNYLVLLMALFLSTFSIPNDIKNRTIYTVVTKPVRASEIVLGRIVGFATVGTAMLVFMGAISYVFVVLTFELSASARTSAGNTHAAAKEWPAQIETRTDAIEPEEPAAEDLEPEAEYVEPEPEVEPLEPEVEEVPPVVTSSS